MRKLKDILWNDMTPLFRMVFYPVLIFIIVMLIWGEQIYRILGW